MIILLGLILLAIAGSPERAHRIGDTLRLLIILGPLPVAAAGYILAKMKGYRSSIGLAILGGLAFGGTSVVGRILTFSHPVWHVLYNPLVFPLIANGVLGILLFSTALQRAQATVINATMTASQTLIPTVIGIIFLGDVARHGLGYLIIIGTVLTTSGVVGLAFGYQKIK